MLKTKPPKPRKCKWCETKFQPSRHMMPFCSPMCNTLYDANKPKKEAERKHRIEKKIFYAKDILTLTKTAKKEVQKYVRLRDINEPCISCRKPTAKQWDGGHYISATNAKTRFNLWNINKQCSHCNDMNSSNGGMYRKYLIEKIGLKKVEWLENQKGVFTYTADYLNRLIKIMRKKNKLMELKNEN